MHDERITSSLANDIDTLWADPGIQSAYKQRAKFQLLDSAQYFFARVHELCKSDYVPTNSDMIRCRVRTTGIVENHFTIEDNRFLMVDVGGQRNERKKWIHCFEGVTAVMYVCAISEYDQVLYEDGKTNRMVESLKLFHDTANLKWFSDTSFVLFLNKRDLFEDKLKSVPISVCFDNWDSSRDPQNFDDAVEFIIGEFEKRGPATQQLYVHVTCATDTNNVAVVFGAAKDIIINNHLADSGLL
jgi:G-protein alpha subunit